MKTSVMVIGLGRFGASAARELMALGHEVLAIDGNESIVNEIAPDVTHAVQLDAADESALRAIGAAEFDHAIVAISSGGADVSAAREPAWTIHLSSRSKSRKVCQRSSGSFARQILTMRSRPGSVSC